MEIEKAPIRTAKKIVTKGKISFAKASKAAEEAGYACVSLKAVDSTAILGEYFEQGAIKTLAPAILVRTMEEIKVLITECNRILELPDSELKPESRERFFKRQTDLIDRQLKLAQSLQEAAVLIGKTAPQEKMLNPSFAPREQVVPQRPVQVNIGIQSNGDVKVDGQAA